MERTGAHLSKEKRLGIAIGLSLIILIAEVAGGLLSNSLALLSDAGHVFTDSLAILLSLIAAVVSKRPSDYRATYGYQRIGLLAAVTNGISLLVIAGYIFFETYKRFMTPPEIKTGLMLYVAVAGLIGNALMAFVLSKGHHDLNIKSAWLHIMGDLLASFGVVIAGVVIYYTGFSLADPIAGAVTALLILLGGIRVVKESTWVFLELVPSGYNVEQISKAILGIPDVQGLHDLHLWSISHGTPAFSAHVWVPDQKLSEADRIRQDIEHTLSHFGIHHTVLQLECAECQQNGLYCQIQTGEMHAHHH